MHNIEFSLTHERRLENLSLVAKTTNRLHTYLILYNGGSAKSAAQQLDVTRNAVQHYIQDWKDHDLIYTEGNQYLFTSQGSYIGDWLSKYIED